MLRAAIMAPRYRQRFCLGKKNAAARTLDHTLLLRLLLNRRRGMTGRLAAIEPPPNPDNQHRPEQESEHTLLRVEDDDDYVVVPYLDHSYGFDDHGDYLVMRQRGYGSYEAQETEGRVCIEDRRPQCDHCGDRVDEDDARPVVVEFRSNGRPRSLETWCRRCVDYHAFNCEGIDEYVSDDLESVDVGDRVYSRPYAEAHNFHMSDFSNEWFEGDPVVMDNGDVWSAEEFSEHGFICRIDGGNYPNTEMHSDFDSVWEGHDDETLEREGFITIHDDRQETLPIAA